MTPTKPTLREMSDHLAEHLLGWRQHSDGKFWLNWSNSNKAINSAWRPHEDVAQCFESIIPAMAGRGFEMNLVFEIGDWHASFYLGSNVTGIQDNNPAAAIVEAAYLAISQE